MPGPKPTPRPSGGSRPSFSQPGESNMDEGAVQAAMQQMQQTQQGTQSGQPTTGGSALQPFGSKQQAAKGGAGGLGVAGAKKPRPIGSLTDELIKYPLQDITEGLKQFFSINTLLGINNEDSPEDQMKKKQMLQRWNKLNEEQRAVAKKRYQEEMQKKQQEEQEKEAKRQQEEQAKASAIQAPSSPKKGPIGPGGSKKQKASQQLQQSRQTIGKVAGAN